MRGLAVLSLALALAAGCQRPSHDDCERLCWRYSELQFWAAFERQAKDLSPADRATLEAERKVEWEQLRRQPTNPGRDNCLTACTKNGRRTQVTCVEAARTADEATACMAAD